MSAELARVIVFVGWSYVALGLLFAIAFIAIGVRVVEPKARGGSLLFHVLIVPGCAALWPVLALEWLRARRASRAAAPDQLAEETS